MMYLAAVVCTGIVQIVSSNAQTLPACPTSSQIDTGDERIVNADQLTAVTEQYAVDGIDPTDSADQATDLVGYTTYRAFAQLGDSLFNLYTLAGSVTNPMSIPPAWQLTAAGFGSDTGGTNPLYWPYNPSTQYDSWLTVGVDDQSGNMGTIGITFEDWTETTGVFVDDGAVFWMDPTAAPGGHSIVAQFTVPTGSSFQFLIGELQGRSVGWDWTPDNPGPNGQTVRIPDWRKDCTVWTQPSTGGAPSPAPAGTCSLTLANMQTTFDNIEKECCNGGHRRMLGESACYVDHCTAACAAIFDPVYENCQNSPFSQVLDGIPSSLIDKCGETGKGR